MKLLETKAVWLVFAVLAAISSGQASELDQFDLLYVPAGKAQLGDADGDDNELVETRHIDAFHMMRHEVTNDQFASFVSASSHKTNPELSSKGYVWWLNWRLVEGAGWRHPQGPQSTIADLGDHPVVQVSARDADAFCAYYGMRLPSDPEWEYAARGTDGRRFPWGNVKFGAAGMRQANAGKIKCCGADAADGHVRTSPVGRYTVGRSPFGLNDMAGNVWEWTSSTFPDHPEWRTLRGGGWGNDPYCLRAAYRHGNRPTTALDMVGFRCVADVK